MREKIKKNFHELKGAWLITWEFHSPNKKRDLRIFGISDEIIDVLDSHKGFDWVLDYTKNIYKVLMGEYSDKILLSKRGKNKMKKSEFFDSHFVSTHYQTKTYQELKKITDTKGIGSKRHKEVLEKWINYPCYISIGHNPSIRTRKVRNIKTYINQNDAECIEWQEKTVSGEWRNKKYTKSI